MKYDITLDMSTNSSQSLILRNIKSGSDVLEFGPATGYMTRYMKEELGCRVWCIEIDPQFAEKASIYCEKMFVLDIDRMEWVKQLKGKFFDHIIFADVLEHLQNPWQVLNNSKVFLKKNGTVLTSIPNIAHNAVVMELLQGKFNYRDEGLLDGTHLRFFTKDSIISLLKQAGLQPIQWMTTMLQPEFTEFRQSYDSFSETFREYLRAREDADVYQYVSVSKRKEEIAPEEVYRMPASRGKPLVTDYLQVFWGQEIFDEINSIKVQIVRNEQLTRHVITLPQEANGRLRLDIGNRPSWVDISLIELYDRNPLLTKDAKVLASYTMDNGFVGISLGPGAHRINSKDSYRILYSNDDPQLFLDCILTGKSKYLPVMVVDLKISDKVLENLLNEFNVVYGELLKKKDEIDNQSLELSKLALELSASNESLVVKQKELSAKNLELAHLRESCTKELSKTKSELSISRKHLEDQRKQLYALQALAAEKERQLKLIISSRFWRMTGSLRWLVDVVKNIYKSVIRFHEIIMTQKSNVRLIPLQNVSYNQKEMEWEAVTDDPQFLIDRPFPVGKVYCHLDITISEPGKLQFFFDKGKGFSEDGSVSIQIPQKGRQSFSILLKIDLDVIRLRFDPTNVQGFFNIHSISFQKFIFNRLIVGGGLLKSELNNIFFRVKRWQSRRELTRAQQNNNCSLPVDVIIPIYNAYDDLIACVNSVLKNTSYPYRLVLIDDKSTDPRIDSFLNDLESRKINNLVIMRNKRNLGFVGTVNRGMAESDSHVVLLNSDTEVPPGWLERLIQAAAQDPLVGTVTPFSNNATICSFPNFCEDNVLPKEYDMEALDKVFNRYASSAVIDIPTAVGFCMLITKSCLDTVGLFDEETFGRGYAEENDFCMRAEGMGFRNVICPNLFVYHKGSMSFGVQQKTLLQENLRKLDQKHPSYRAKVRSFIERDPLEPVRKMVQSGLVIELRKTDLGVLQVLHGLGGGTVTHVEDIISMQKGVVRNYVLKPYPKHFELIDRNQTRALSYTFSKEEALQPGWFSKLLKSFNIGLVHVHHLHGYPEEFVTLLMETRIPYLFTSHDYYTACPTINLLDSKSVYCGAQKDLDICKKCLRAHPDSNIAGIDPRRWRDRWAEFLGNAVKILAPSKAAAEIMEHYFEQIKVHPVEHGVDSYGPLTVDNEDYNPEIPLDGDKIRIALLGAIGPHKGSHLLEELVRLTRLRSLPFQWVVIGYTNLRQVRYCSTDNVLAIHGPYEPIEIPQLLSKYCIDLVFLPSVWPETYSYTLSEAWLSGYPVLSPDLGALGQRIRETDAGWLLKQLCVEEILDTLQELALDRSKIAEARKKTSRVTLPDREAMADFYYGYYHKLYDSNRINEGLSPEEIITAARRKHIRIPRKDFVGERFVRTLLGFLRRTRLKIQRRC